MWHPRTTRSGARYQVATDTLAEDVALALRTDSERLARLGWQRRKRLLAYAVPGVESRLAAGRRVRLVTLPCPGASMGGLAVAWSDLRKRIVREAGELEFCGTRAFGRVNGLPHGHVLADWGDAWLDQVWFSEAWSVITGHRVVDVRQVKSVGAARYVAANVAGYLSDQAGGRMFRSRGWLLGSPDGS